jgi:hypothetical protein
MIPAARKGRYVWFYELMNFFSVLSALSGLGGGAVPPGAGAWQMGCGAVLCKQFQSTANNGENYSGISTIFGLFLIYGDGMSLLAAIPHEIDSFWHIF